MRRTTIVALLLLLGLSPVAFTQDQGGVNPNGLPKGVSAAEARRIFQGGEADGDKIASEIRAHRKRQLDEIQAITAPAREALKRVLDADRSGTYKSYLADLERIGKMTDRKARTKVLSTFDAKYLAFFQDSFRKANINEADLKTKIARILPGATFGPLLTAYGKEPDDESEEMAHATATRAAFSTQSFTKPYGIRSTKKFSQGIAFQGTDATADLGDGGLFVVVAIGPVIGNGEAQAAVGQAVNAAPGVNAVRGTIETTSGYEMSAGAAVAVAGAWVDERIEIDKPDGVRRTKTHNFGWVIAPIGWFAQLEGDDEPLTITRQVGVPDPSSGGQFQIKARVIANAYSYGLFGVGTGSGNATLKKITVEFKH